MRLIVFRFLFLYFILLVADGWMSFLSPIPGLGLVFGWCMSGIEAVVQFFNQFLLHVRPVLNTDGGGSGDTSFAWAMFFTVLILALIGALVWTVIDRKRHQPYSKLWLVMVHSLRYFLVVVSFTYGIIKVFHAQMPFPNASQLATPLGDFLPMRLMWMYMGYSGLYQAFSGWAELLVGLLLLWRPTLVLGAVIGLGVYAHVFVLNLAYDVPVKLNSMQLMLACVFLVATDAQRLLNLFLLNKPTAPTKRYHWPLANRWQRIGRWAVKVVVVLLGLILPAAEFLLPPSMAQVSAATVAAPAPAHYETLLFVKNGDTLPALARDSMVWKDLILEANGSGSVQSCDTMLRQRYRRGYFDYRSDTAEQLLSFYFRAADSLPIGRLRYALHTPDTLLLWGRLGADSLHLALLRSNRHYQLAERQFHWVSERNR